METETPVGASLGLIIICKTKLAPERLWLRSVVGKKIVPSQLLLLL